MSKYEIKKMFFWSNSHWLPCGLNIREQLWWRLMPGVVINVKWPKGWVVLHEDTDGSAVSTESADPNDRYRPWMEQNVGRQGWDWDWGIANTDLSENRLTIKFRRKHASHATIATLRWS